MMVGSAMPANAVQPTDLWGLVGLMAAEIGIGLTIGFVSRMVFFVLEIAGGLISSEIGLSIPPGLNPLTEAPLSMPSSILYYLAAMLWLTLDMHHWMLIAFQKTYTYLPIGGVHISQAFINDLVGQTGGIFVVALELAAPLLAVAFIISLVFSVMGRAVPQMNVFAESFAVRPLVGLSVFGMGLNLMAEHIMNYLHHLPEDMLRVCKLLH